MKRITVLTAAMAAMAVGAAPASASAPRGGITQGADTALAASRRHRGNGERRAPATRRC